jgi:4-amino-4-deoxy-L-arabinose transferase-like glycosyltransferase
MDRALALYAGFLLGLLAKPPVVLAVLSLVSLYVFIHENRQRHKWEVNNYEHECKLDATLGIT